MVSIVIFYAFTVVNIFLFLFNYLNLEYRYKLFHHYNGVCEFQNILFMIKFSFFTKYCYAQNFLILNSYHFRLNLLIYKLITTMKQATPLKLKDPQVGCIGISIGGLRLH